MKKMAKKKARKNSSPQKVKREGGIQKLFNFCEKFARGIEQADAAKDWTQFGRAMSDLRSTYREYKKELQK